MSTEHDEMRRAAAAVPECPFARMVIRLADELEEEQGVLRRWADALDFLAGPSAAGGIYSDDLIETYRESGGGYEGLQAVARYVRDVVVERS